MVDSRTVMAFEEWMTDICITPNAIDYVCIADFRKATRQANIIRFEPTKLSEERKPSMAEVKAIIGAEKAKYDLVAHDEERFERTRQCMYFWVPCGDGFFGLFVSRDGVNEKLFKLAVDDHKNELIARFNSIREQIRLKKA